MKLLFFRSTVLAVIIFCILLIVRIQVDGFNSQNASKFSSQRIRRTLVRKVLVQDHSFVSANDPRFNVCSSISKNRTS